jgi:DNA-binding CsgD family transcriptional regulator
MFSADLFFRPDYACAARPPPYRFGRDVTVALVVPGLRPSPIWCTVDSGWRLLQAASRTMPPAPDAHELTDLVYASVLGERPWQDFLDALSRLLPNGKAFLFFHDSVAGVGAFKLSSGLEPDSNAAYNSYYSTVNPWMHGACTRQVGRVVRAEAMLPRECLAKTEFYGDWLHPQKLASGIGVTILREQDCNFLLSVLAADAEDAIYDHAIATVQALVPHLQRAFNWYRSDQSGALGLFKANGLSGNLRVGIITLGAGRKVREVSDVAVGGLERTPGLSIDCAGRLCCAVPSVTECIDAKLSNWVHDQNGAAPVGFLLPCADRAQPVRLTVMARPDACETDYFRRPECIVLLVEPIRDLDFAVEEFATLHGLTGAEKRVVAGLASGRTLKEVAKRDKVSTDTVRTQVKQVFAKTGFGRQADLVRNVCLIAGTIARKTD